MFKNNDSQNNDSNNDLGVFRPSKGSAKVVIGNGVKFKGEITDADEVQVEGRADVTLNTDNLVVGAQGELKGNIESCNADIWGKVDGTLKITGTLTIQEQGVVSGSTEYQNLQIKLGGKISGDLKVSEKVKKITDAPKNTSNVSLQESVKEEKNK
jgi:cytoskeletal protein CcmA (bactofilin family)